MPIFLIKNGIKTINPGAFKGPIEKTVSWNSVKLGGRVRESDWSKEIKGVEYQVVN